MEETSVWSFFGLTTGSPFDSKDKWELDNGVLFPESVSLKFDFFEELLCEYPPANFGLAPFYIAK